MADTKHEEIDEGFCPHCGCPDASVRRTKRWQTYSVEKRGRRLVRVYRTKIRRYRVCDHCRKPFTTTEVVD